MKPTRIKIILSFILFAIAFSACEKLEIGKDIPLCIKKQIRKEEGSCLNDVIEYIEIPTSKEKEKSKKSRIYRFMWGRPDCLKEVVSPITYYDEQCNPISVSKNYDSFEYDNREYTFNRYVYQYYIKR
jgi:hypothetical protein